MYHIMILCRTGTSRIISGDWVDEYHIITWCVENSKLEANGIVNRLNASNSGQRVWKSPNSNEACGPFVPQVPPH